MNEDEKPFDEQFNDFLWHCYKLKKKAEAIQSQKKSLPTWLHKLLDNKP